MIPPRSHVHALLDANATWADAVDRAEPGFFHKSAQGQYPKARAPAPLLTPLSHVHVHRSSGSDAQTRASQNQSSPAHAPATSLSTATLPSTSPRNSFSCHVTPHTDRDSQFHADDDSALAVLSYAVDVVGVEHGAFPA